TGALLAADPAEALELVARGARRVTEAAAVWITVPMGDGSARVAACDGGPEELRDRVFVRLEGGIYAATMASGAPVVVDDPSQDPRSGRDLASSIGVGPLLAVPLVAGGEHLGALFIGHAPGGPSFAPTDVTMASTFAAHA